MLRSPDERHDWHKIVAILISHPVEQMKIEALAFKAFRIHAGASSVASCGFIKPTAGGLLAAACRPIVRRPREESTTRSSSNALLIPEFMG